MAASTLRLVLKATQSSQGRVALVIPPPGRILASAGPDQIEMHELTTPIFDGPTPIGEIQISRAHAPFTPGDHTTLLDASTSIGAAHRVATGSETAVLHRINEISVELASLPSSEDLHAYLARALRTLTGAAVATVGEYVSQPGAIHLKHVECEDGLLARLASLMPGDVRALTFPVDESLRQVLIRDRVGYRKSLHEVSFGAIPLPVSMLFQVSTGIDRFVGMSYVFQGQMYGTSVLAFRHGQQLPSVSLLDSFSALAAVSLRRRQAEHALRSSEAAYRSLFEQSPFGIALLNQTGIYVDVNDLFCAFFEAPRERILGAHPVGLGFLTADDGLRIEDSLRDGNGILTGHRVHVTTATGHSRTLDVSVKVIEIGGSPHYLTLCDDITARLERERQHHRLEQQLAEAKRHEYVGRLAGGVAHEFNNLLTVINGYSTLLLDHAQPATALYDGLTRIHRAGDRAALLTRQLLGFSARQIIRPRSEDLNRIILAARPMLEGVLGDAIAFEAVLDPHIASIWADPHQLEQVLLNLTANARDAMPRGGSLRIETSTCSSAGLCDLCGGALEHPAYVRLTVADTGEGIDQAVQSHLFEPFFTTKATGQGTGLGLSSVHGIMKQNGGHIDVLSKPGQGATFFLFFPAMVQQS